MLDKEIEELRLLPRSKVEELTSLSRAGIYAAMLEGSFPRPVQTGKRSVAWRAGEIREWLKGREKSDGWKEGE